MTDSSFLVESYADTNIYPPAWQIAFGIIVLEAKPATFVFFNPGIAKDFE